MAEFFLFLSILIDCGVFPMSWSDCGRRPHPTAIVQPVERVEAP